ncbi:MAG: 3-phosphoshikimate 1-carboxyvinyltransferase [Marinirhabdus sp.]|nr:3-phosphoshikimate 1-carboxyvinyltransferase [Marinirhabdus sp.]
MKLNLRGEHPSNSTIQISGSKSETNRLLILQALYPQLEIQHASNSDDSTVLKAALESTENVVDVHHAGTAMRFLTAYFASKPGREVLLTGSARMQERPIGILVEALQGLGAQIQYEKQKGYPPLRIKGTTLHEKSIAIQADVSSQFISALLLIAPSLPKGLELKLQGTLTSKPYIEMTLSLLEQCGIAFHFDANTITVNPFRSIEPTTIVVESDWSSASYFYSLVALSEDLEITLGHYKEKSLQGDRAVVRLYEKLGVSTDFKMETQQMVLRKTNKILPKQFQADLSNTPDLAQTIAVTCFGLGVACQFTGLHTLKIKETDRLLALQMELQKLGGEVHIDANSIRVATSKQLTPNVAIDTYNDHRMAMAFAPLALKVPITINAAEVVSKSFPTFWECLKTLGVQVHEM